jgi:hypothetical protein
MLRPNNKYYMDTNSIKFSNMVPPFIDSLYIYFKNVDAHQVINFFQKKKKNYFIRQSFNQL